MTSSHSEVKAACDDAVDAISALEESDQAGWVVYILEQLDGASRLGLVLGNVASDLDRRLREADGDRGV